jgi:Tfp pilus assembly protein PilN
LAAARAGDLPILEVGLDAAHRGAAAPNSTLSALHEAPSFNFELTEERALAARKRAAVRRHIAATLLAGAIIMVFAVTSVRQSAAMRVSQARARWTRRLNQEEAARDKVRAEADTLQTTVGELKTAFEPAQPLPDILGVVGDTLPAGAWLNSIRVARGKQLEIHGTADTVSDVAVFTSRLQANPRFRSITIVYANSGAAGKSPTVLFEIRATCVGNLPLVAPNMENGEENSSSDETGEEGQ